MSLLTRRSQPVQPATRPPFAPSVPRRARPLPVITHPVLAPIGFGMPGGNRRCLYSIGAAALVCRVKRKTIYNTLSVHRAEFPPRYRRGKDHPRRLRVLTRRELRRLLSLLRLGPLA